MPELPEVETIRCGLEPKITGQIIADIDSDNPGHLNMPLAGYKKIIKGKKVLSVNRRAKMIYFALSGGYVIAIHLKMSGQLVFRHGKELVIGGHPIKDGEVGLPNKYTHVIYYFKSGDVLFFNDTRKFGWARLFTEKEFDTEIKRLGYGPEPLSDDFSAVYFDQLLKRYPKREIKKLLLDQQSIAGIGNIYADEVCYYAKVRPTRTVKTLREEEIKSIYKGIKKILHKAIECGGSSIASHLDAFGRKGSYSKYHMVYGRYGEPCLKCGTILKRLTVAGRTSTYCPKEQK